MLTKNIFALLIVVIMASFTGFCVENVWIFFRYGYTDNRGMIFPFLLGYGIACVLTYFCFGLPENPKIFGLNFVNTGFSQALYILCVFFSILIGESALGYIVEYFTGIKWWDYSSIPLHIGRYTSIPTSIGFSLAVYVFMGKIFPYFYHVGENLFDEGKTFGIFEIILLLLFDLIHAFVYMNRHHETYKTWKYERHFKRRRRNA